MTDRKHTLETAWPGISGSLALLRNWDGLNTLMLESHDDSANEASMAIAAELGGALTLLDEHASPEQWRDAVADHMTGHTPASASRAMGKERICAILTNYDRASPKLWSAVKGAMERAPSPQVAVAIIANVGDAESIPAEYRSFFRVVRKSGRPRTSKE